MLFSFLFLFLSANATIVDLQECQQKTRDLLCVTDFMAPETFPQPYDFVKWTDIAQNRKCKSDKEAKKDYFMAALKATPEIVQRTICNTQVIFLEEGDNEYYGGMVGYSYDTKDITDEIVNGDWKTFKVKATGLILHVNTASRIDNPETCAMAAQRRFSSAFLPSQNLEALPNFIFESDSQMCDLVYTLVHESGHLLDLANGAISSQESWFKKSFNMVPVDSNGYKYDSYTPHFDINLLTSMQQGQLLLEQAPIFLNFLNQSPFTTYYSMFHPVEDFAEEYTFILGLGHYQVQSQGITLVDSLLNSKSVQGRIDKVLFLQQQLIRPDLKYKMEPHYETVTVPSGVVPPARIRQRAGIPNVHNY